MRHNNDLGKLVSGEMVQGTTLAPHNIKQATQCSRGAAVVQPLPPSLCARTLNTWPRCPPQLAHVISVRTMPMVRSSWRSTAPLISS